MDDFLRNIYYISLSGTLFRLSPLRLGSGYLVGHVHKEDHYEYMNTAMCSMVGVSITYLYIVIREFYLMIVVEFGFLERYNVYIKILDVL